MIFLRTKKFSAPQNAVACELNCTRPHRIYNFCMVCDMHRNNIKSFLPSIFGKIPVSKLHIFDKDV